jgi:hypothetical protein
VIAWKFLQPGAVGLFSGFEWPTPTASQPGPWVEVEPPLVRALRGVHAVRTAWLLDWLGDELWEIELAGEIADANGLLVASRGRLLRRVSEWDAPAAAAFAAACVLAVRDMAADALARTGDSEGAAALAGSSDQRELRALVEERAPVGHAGLAFLDDCLLLASGRRPDAASPEAEADHVAGPGAVAANLGYVAAAAVGVLETSADPAPGAFERGFGRERERQQAWLAKRLRLDAVATSYRAD